MKREIVEIQSNGKTIRGIVDVPPVPRPQPGMIICHGLTNDKFTCPLIEEATGLCTAKGIAVFRFDFFGSGDSDGIFKEKTVSKMIRNLEDATRYLRTREGIDRNRVGLWGRSVGGAIVAACSDPAMIKTNIMISAPVLLYKTFYPLFERFGKMDMTPIGRAKEVGQAATGKVKGELELPRAFFEELEDVEERIGKNLSGMKSVIVVQGDSDRKVAVENARWAYNLVREPKQLHIIEGADHAYTSKEADVLTIVSRWIEANLLAVSTLA